MSGASSVASLYGACLGYVWGIIWGMSGACLGLHLGMSGASSGVCLGQSTILLQTSLKNETMQCLLSYSDDEHRDKYIIYVCMTKTMTNLGFNLVNQNPELLSSCSPPSFKFLFSVPDLISPHFYF